jgi:coenzyme F420-0:L-glutamate ligase/coenzyme F420-1:gamma-L-glutamate ligase
MTLTITPIYGIPDILPGDQLGNIIINAIVDNNVSLENGDILVITQKIVSKSENCYVSLQEVSPSSDALILAREAQKDPRIVELIFRESKKILRVRPGLLIVEHRLGFICANAGIDQSNTKGERGSPDEIVLLLPENPDLSARNIRDNIQQHFKINAGILIIDSFGRAWRLGTVGTAIGLSGLPGLIDLRGIPDMFRRKLQTTEIGAADELASAASLTMGQAAERVPVVHVRGFPYPLREANHLELIRTVETDLFR